MGSAIAVFLGTALVTLVCGVRLVALGDVLADRTGWGEALFGAVLFGAATSVAGIIMTAVSAADGHPELAYSSAVGGIAAQTLAIVLADLAYRRANLEHAAASAQNLLFGWLLIMLLGVALMASFSPDVTLLGLHPASLAMILVYVGGLRLIHAQPTMWRAVQTDESQPDEPEPHGRLGRRRLSNLWAEFIAIAAITAVAGWAVAKAAESIMVATGLQSGFVGAVLMGVVNALPESVTAVAAVRRGAMTLAIAAIIGGNSLDVLTLAVGDVAFTGGSLYHAAGADQLFLTSASLLMTTVLLGGMLVRQQRGWGRLGFEGVLLTLVYVGTVVVLAF
ncbi:cation transporter [Nonomuraea sp. NPDC050404]|uniref:sodium:calcium antiporter n=1 Tax=Nonomuraea sp. NPDC050404 TaxID=3155783 RepID=UPI0033FD117A